MPRGMLSDDLRVHEFHLLDVDWSFNIPPFVLFPSVGFTSITMPEITIDTEEVREGTSDFIHKVLGKSNTNVITLTKGVSPFNSDFWRWTVACLKGTPSDPNANIVSFLADLGKAVTFLGAPEIPGKRRNLLLLHATGISLEGLAQSMASGNPFDAIKGVALLPQAGVTAIAQGLSTITQGMVDVGITSIPGKVYMLFDCLPTRYKPGSDFDASSTAVSIEELDITYSRFEEFSLTA